MGRMKTNFAADIFVVSNLLSAAECEQLIARGEALGFEPAAVRTQSGAQLRTDIRDNDRAVFQDAALAADLWRRVEEHVPHQFEGGTVVGLDDQFKFYRYDVGQQFRRHKDGTEVKSPLVRSRLTCLFYLNDGFAGGETAFYSEERIEMQRVEIAAIAPQAGAALFFRHEWWHAGRPLASGRKYVLRSDVYYEFTTPAHCP